MSRFELYGKRKCILFIILLLFSELCFSTFQAQSLSYCQNNTHTCSYELPAASHNEVLYAAENSLLSSRNYTYSCKRLAANSKSSRIAETFLIISAFFCLFSLYYKRPQTLFKKKHGFHHAVIIRYIHEQDGSKH